MLKDLDSLSATQIQELKAELCTLLEEKDKIITKFFLVRNEKNDLESQVKAKKNFMNEYSGLLEKSKNSEHQKDNRIQIMKKQVLDKIDAKTGRDNSLKEKYQAEVELVKSIWVKNKNDFENEKRSVEGLLTKARSDLWESDQKAKRIEKEINEIEKKLEDDKNDTSIYSEMYEKSLGSLRFRLYEVNMALFKEQENSLKLVNEISELENEF